MNRMMRLVLVVTLCLAGGASRLAAQDSIASARQLYGSAAYDEALSMLDRLKAAPNATSADAFALEQYRAFCLMALGRQPEAVQAIEAVVVADPFYLPSEGDVSPRVVGTFRDARRRLVPVMAQQRYLSAKAAYDRKEYATALAGFEATMRMIESPDLAEAASQPPLSDLRTLVGGFRDLARSAATPPAPKVEPKPAPAPVAPPPPPPPPKAFYVAEDAGVVPPVTISQRVPRWPANGAPGFLPKGRRAVVEFLITEEGTVDSVVVRPSIAKFYDELLVSEAKSWRYKPATKDNVPVKFKKVIQVTVE